MEDEEILKPKSIITIYSGVSYNQDNGCYVEVQDVKMTNTGEIIYGAARPITRDAMTSIMEATIAKEESNYFSSKLLPENLLMFNPGKYSRKIVWWRKAGKIRMTFKSSLKIPNGEISMPALLLISFRDKLQVFALKENKRPSEKTDLYNAPLLNYFSNNTICWGSVKINTSEITEIDKEMRYWESKLWDSEFSHAGAEITIEEDIILLYKDLAKTGKPFPINKLVSSKLKLIDVL